jgi:lipopolysaccharide/colanic/teichoic acid biosynthesis glycosyltransferase
VVWEFAAALALLVPAAPVILAAALLVKLTSRGPAFYTQTRVGRHGRLFTIYKLRTMIHNCESLTGPRWAVPGDPRVTRVGRFLRLTHIDELPQLLNVLRGEMGLIGPRPERPELLPELERGVSRYCERLSIRPGLTGLAQVQLPPDTDLTSVGRKLACDLYYIQHLGPRLDLSILLCTALYVLGVPGRLARHLFRVPSSSTVERAVPITVREGAGARLRRSA